MKLLRCKDSSLFQIGSVATIGNFDGIHLGHQLLLKQLKAKALELGLPSVVVIFEPQPNEYFNKEKPTARLTTLREKIKILKEYQIDYVLCLKFDNKLAAMLASDFVEHYFLSFLKLRYLLVGADFHFGFKRSGDVAYLQNIASRSNFTVEVFSDFKINEGRVSSTRVREQLKNGNLNEAALLLGRRFSLLGRVIKGKQLGRQWGIPTANIAMHRPTLPLGGVFCVLVKRENQKELLKAVANLGKRPTLDGVKTILEIHILDFADDIYGEMLEVFFIHKLRDEQRFDSIDALIAKIQQDIIEAKNYFTFNELTE
ncbi:MAG: bifunctional riboflavin kinase/FAD synthetase [Proteobacteria bacterium]|nr:bifunctional riboflavin kinase/FAD synthetase [Pseudomonadota bacterium]